MPLLVEDRDLLRRFRAGEPDALERVFVHYAPYVAGILRRGFSFPGGEAAVRFAGYDTIFDLEDVVQEVFRRALSEAARASYDGLRPFRAYLTTIAKNAVINEYHARRRDLERFTSIETEEAAPLEDWSAADDPLAAEPREASGDPERDVLSDELRRLVGEFRGRLDPQEQHVFELRFVDGCSHAQITARIGLSASKIKTIEAHIRKALLRFLRKSGYLGAQRAHRPPAERQSPAADIGDGTDEQSNSEQSSSARSASRRRA